MVGVFFATITAIFLAMQRLGGSRSLHVNILTRMLGAPIDFFDTTPTGVHLSILFYFTIFLLKSL